MYFLLMYIGDWDQPILRAILNRPEEYLLSHGYIKQTLGDNEYWETRALPNTVFRVFPVVESSCHILIDNQILELIKGEKACKLS